MDFLDPKKKRAHKIRLIVGYILIGVMIGLVTLILVFQSYGYDLDRKTGSIIQNGLLYVTAGPQAASVFVDDKQYSSESNVKLVLPSDIYNLMLKRSGYRTWQRTVSLPGGTIQRIIYPWLFPSKLDTAKQTDYTTAPAFATESPDRHWLVIQKPGSLTSFDVYDATDYKKAPTGFTVPDADFTNPTEGTLKLVEWSTDNRHFLVQHLNDDGNGGQEFVMVDRTTPDQSYNVDKTFGTTPTKVDIRDNHYDHLYMLDSSTKVLSYAELKTPSSVTTVLSNVEDFKSYGTNLILYASDANAPAGKVNVMVHDTDGNWLLRSITAGDTYALNLAQYNGDWYVAAGSNGEGRVYVYKNPFPIIKHQTTDPLFPVTALRVADPQWLSFSANTQFIVAEDGSTFAVYDAEYNKTYLYDTGLTQATPDAHAAWMDGDRLMLVSNGKTVVFDYDGTNRQTLTPALPGLPIMFDSNYKYLYNLAPASTAPAAQLTRTDLLVK